jgi:hypothetical protein
MERERGGGVLLLGQARLAAACVILKSARLCRGGEAEGLCALYVSAPESESAHSLTWVQAYLPGICCHRGSTLKLSSMIAGAGSGVPKDSLSLPTPDPGDLAVPLLYSPFYGYIGLHYLSVHGRPSAGTWAVL